MWFKILRFMACIVFICKACTFDFRTIPFTDDYFDPLDYDTEEMHKLYDYRYILLTINCAVNLNSFNTTVRSKTIVMFVCTNSSHEGYDHSQYKDTVLNHYNIISNTESLMIVFGSESRPSMYTVKKMVVFGRIINLKRCDELQEISVINSNLEPNSDWTTFTNIFSEITNLTKLDIRDTPMSKYKIMRILSDVIVKELTLRNCSLYDLPHNFLDLARGLTRLDLSHNHLRFVTPVSASKRSSMFENLEFMDLSYNDLRHGASFMYTAALMPRLRYMILDHNSHLDICNLDYFNDQSKKQKDKQWIVFSDLRNISASFTGTSRLCFDLMKLENLVVFNISYSMVSTLSELPAFTASNFTVDLRGNDITNIRFFGINDYKAMKTRFIERNNTKTSVFANVKQLQCDCQHSWLQKALNDIPNLQMQDVSCSNGIQLIHLQRDSLNCTKFDCGDCVCRRYVKSTTANCSSSLTHTIPIVKDLSHIYAASNRIQSLNVSLFNNMVVWVDVSANLISRLDLKTITAMFSKEDRHFKLAGNPIICDCKNQELLRTFRLHRLQVDDYKELSCAGGEILLNDVKEDQLCGIKWSISGIFILIIASVSIVLLILPFFYFVYYQIIIFLYGRGR